MEAMSASRPHEMKSSTSQRAGSSRTFLKTMYFTSGAYVMTRRLRTWTLPVLLYSLHRARASSEEILLRLLLDCDFMGRLPRREGTDGQVVYRVRTRSPSSPLWGNSLPVESVGPRKHLGDGRPQRLRNLVAEGQLGQRGGQLGV